MLNLLIVEDDIRKATSLAAMLQQEQDYRVAGFANNLSTALKVARCSNVHIAFIDVQLARLDSGYRIADELKRVGGISCVLVTAAAPPFPMPELAAAWLEEPYNSAAIRRSLTLASADLLNRAQSGHARERLTHGC